MPRILIWWILFGIRKVMNIFKLKRICVWKKNEIESKINLHWWLWWLLINRTTFCIRNKNIEYQKKILSALLNLFLILTNLILARFLLSIFTYVQHIMCCTTQTKLILYNIFEIIRYDVYLLYSVTSKSISLVL